MHLRRLHDADEFHPEFGLVFRQFVRLVSQRPRKVSGQTFGYQWAQSPNGSDNTIWLLSFYGRPEYFCTTFRAADIEGLTWEEELRRVQALTPPKGLLHI